MPVPTTIADLSTTAASNYPQGGEAPNVIDDYIRAYGSVIRQVSDANATAITAERTAVATLTNKTLTAPTLTTPALGTPASGNLANCSFPTLNQNTTGTAAGLSATLPVNRGGTGLTAPGANGNVLTSNGSAWVSSALPAVGLETSDFTGANQSKAVKGYQKLPGGLIIQWGTVTASTSPVAESFATNFPTACVTVQLTGSNTAGSYFQVSASSLSTTGFNAYSASGALSCTYLAIGY